MSIPIKNYINIISVTVGGAALSRRSTELRITGDDPLLPVGAVVEFFDANQVGGFFGYSSLQFSFAKIYFGFVSKVATKALKLSWFNVLATSANPIAFGKPGDNGISLSYGNTCALDIVIDGTSNALTVDLTGVSTPADVASTFETAMQALAGDFATATATYDTDTNAFIVSLLGHSPLTSLIILGTNANGNALAAGMGMAGLAIYSLGKASTSIITELDAMANLSNDFFSFGYIDANDSDVTADYADWALIENNTYAYLGAVDMASYDGTPAYAAVIDKALSQGGNGLTKSTIGQFVELLPGMVMGATDYTKRGAAKNFMYQQDGAFEQYSVTDEAEYNKLKDLGINFYGQTQSAGTNLSFYQWGVMSGGTKDIRAMGPFFNEIWLKDAITVAMMNEFIANENIAADVSGNQRISGAITTICQEEAKFNGVISIGKELTVLQKASITEMSGDDQAWVQIQSLGFWLDVNIVPQVDQGITTYVGEYLLIYAKGDSISMIDGRNVAI